MFYVKSTNSGQFTSYTNNVLLIGSLQMWDIKLPEFDLMLEWQQIAYCWVLDEKQGERRMAWGKKRLAASL